MSGEQLLGMAARYRLQGSGNSTAQQLHQLPHGAGEDPILRFHPQRVLQDPIEAAAFIRKP
jgi:hypothetical protein